MIDEFFHYWARTPVYPGNQLVYLIDEDDDPRGNKVAVFRGHIERLAWEAGILVFPAVTVCGARAMARRGDDPEQLRNLQVEQVELLSCTLEVEKVETALGDTVEMHLPISEHEVMNMQGGWYYFEGVKPVAVKELFSPDSIVARHPARFGHLVRFLTSTSCADVWKLI